MIENFFRKKKSNFENLDRNFFIMKKNWTEIFLGRLFFRKIKKTQILKILKFSENFEIFDIFKKFEIFQIFQISKFSKYIFTMIKNICHPIFFMVWNLATLSIWHPHPKHREGRQSPISPYH